MEVLPSYFKYWPSTLEILVMSDFQLQGRIAIRP
jgi:hypothetical protein